MEHPKFMVTVSCMTYNQSKYITDAMNGFTMQQTSFPFVCTIVDDASTDGEQDVIRKYVEENFDFSEGSVAYHKETDYAHIAYAQHNTNKNCYFAVLYLKENHYSQSKDKSPYLKEWQDGVEYMAICEGDDFWIDRSKLQKQVEYLDQNPNISCCTHQSIIVRDGKETEELFCKLPYSKATYKIKDVLEERLFHTASYLYRNYEELNNMPRVLSGDKLLILLLASKGGILFLPEIMCIYRKTNFGLSSTATVNDMKRDLLMIPFLMKLFPKFPKYRELSSIYRTIAFYSHDISKFEITKYALISFWYSFSYFPYNIIYIAKKIFKRVAKIHDNIR